MIVRVPKNRMKVQVGIIKEGGRGKGLGSIGEKGAPGALGGSNKPSVWEV